MFVFLFFIYNNDFDVHVLKWVDVWLFIELGDHIRFMFIMTDCHYKHNEMYMKMSKIKNENDDESFS